MVSIRPGPSSTDRGLPDRITGSPKVTPARLTNEHTDPFMESQYPRTGFFIDLNSRLICCDSNDFSDKVIVTDADLVWSAHYRPLSRQKPEDIQARTSHILSCSLQQ